MSNIEIIDRLLNIISEQSDIIRDQTYILEQNKNDNGTFKRKRAKIENELNVIEYNLREPVRYSDITGYDDAEI